VQVRDLAAWDRLADHSAAHAHWTRELSGLPRHAACPLTGGNLPEGTYVETYVGAPLLSPRVAGDLTAVAKLYAVSPAMLALAALVTLLYGCTGRDCLVLGVFYYNRRQPHSRPLMGSLFDVVPLRLDIVRTASLGELARHAQRQFALAEANPLPWRHARALLGGPCDFALNFYRDLPQPTASVVTPEGHATIEEYRPLHPRYAYFPVAAPWFDGHVSVDVRPSSAGTDVSICGSPAALKATRAASLAKRLSDLLRRLGFRHSDSVADIAAKYT
jgi:hypothetical protein